MKLFKDYLPESDAHDDLQEKFNDLKHFRCLVELEIDSKTEFKRSKVFAKLKSVERKSFSPRSVSKSVHFTVYAPHVFEAFRDSLGISNESYINVRAYTYFIYIYYTVKRNQYENRYINICIKIL